MIGSTLALVIAAGAFIGLHFLLASPPLRPALVGALGEKAFAGAYSALMIALLTWYGFAFGAAPFVMLWPTPRWAVWLPAIVVAFSVFLLVCANSQFNPIKVQGAFAAADRPAAPGILAVTRHPTMWGIGLWALSHIPANGDLAALILFGGLAFLALAGTLALDAKYRARDPQGFARLAAASSNVPFIALVQGRAKLNFAEIGWARVAIAVVIYLALGGLHRWIAGVPIG
jgi:uncharacterized membrane protein